MKKPLSQKRIQEARRLVQKWKRRLGLEEWVIEIRHSEENAPEEDHAGEITASVRPDPTYLQATITFYPSWHGSYNDQREAAIVHELSHCLVEELARQVFDLHQGRLVTPAQRIDAVERLTQRISFIALRDHRPERKN